jgi:hypothetical protein
MKSVHIYENLGIGGCHIGFGSPFETILYYSPVHFHLNSPEHNARVPGSNPTPLPGPWHTLSIPRWSPRGMGWPLRGGRGKKKKIIKILKIFRKLKILKGGGGHPFSSHLISLVEVEDGCLAPGVGVLPHVSTLRRIWFGGQLLLHSRNTMSEYFSNIYTIVYIPPRKYLAITLISSC